MTAPSEQLQLQVNTECEGCPHPVGPIREYHLTWANGTSTITKYCSSCAHLVKHGWLPDITAVKEVH